jgi:hypothetical protein
MTRTRRWATILAVAALAALPAAAVAVTFGEPEDIPTNGVPASHELRLGLAADGTVVAAWADFQPGGRQQVKASVRPAGGAFGVAQELSPDGVYGELLYFGVGSQGHALAVWREEGVTAQPRYATRAPGGAFGPAADLPVPGGYDGGALFDVGPDGAAAAIYPTHDATSDEIVASVRDPSTGNWGAFEQVAGVPSSSQPRVAPCGVKFAPSGDVLALYRSMGATAMHLRAKYRPAGGSWVNEQSFPAGSSCDDGEQRDRGLDVDASGRFAVLWFGADNNTYAAIRGPGQAGAWASTVIVLNDQPLGSSLAADDAGDVVAGLDMGGGGIILARYSASSTTWDTSTRFAQTPAVLLQEPRVGADRDSGAFVVAVRRQASGSDKIFATGADGPEAAFGPLTRLGPQNQLFTVGSVTGSGATWAIGFQEYDGSEPDDPEKLKLVLPGTATVTPPPGPGDPAPTGGGTPTPSGDPTPGPGPSTTGALPKFATLVELPSAKRCVKRKATLRIRLRLPAGLLVDHVVVTVNGKRFKVIRGAKLSKPVTLPRRARRVAVTLHLADGRKITGKRTYRRCPRRKG